MHWFCTKLKMVTVLLEYIVPIMLALCLMLLATYFSMLKIMLA